MADANTAVYAVVDKSKKRKNRFVPEKNEEYESDYSMASLDKNIMYSTLNPNTPTAQVTNQRLSQPTNQIAEKTPEKERSWNEGTSCKIFACIFITIAVVALILLICIAILFAEVNKLKQTASPQQSPLGQLAPNDSNIMSAAIIEQLHTLVRVYSTLENNAQQLNSSIEMLKGISLVEHLGHSKALPVTSCAALLALFPSSPSGDYWVRASNGSAVRVYCNMTWSCGGVTGGWVRVAELDMTDSSQQCLDGLTLRKDSNIRTCGSTGLACSSVTFSAPFEYSRVCGKIIGYQRGSTDTFRQNVNIDGNYLDGISLTHGSNPRQHIWTFAAGLDERQANCPCTNTGFAGTTSQPPEFVGNDYFCDTGAERFAIGVFYLDDPLWDGAGCGPLNTCCSFNNPPWFNKELPEPTTDDIEMRVCRDQPRSDEDVQIQTINIFVQ